METKKEIIKIRKNNQIICYFQNKKVYEIDNENKIVKCFMNKILEVRQNCKNAFEQFLDLEKEFINKNYLLKLYRGN